MRLPFDRAVLVLRLLVEGMSIRSAERITGHHRDTIMRLLVLAGRRAERLLEHLLREVPVRDVQADEIWGYVRMKEATKVRRGIEDEQVGDAYAFVGIERDSKLILTWHLGRRTAQHADAFAAKLERATSGRFQVTTDGFAGYPEAINYHLGTRTDLGLLIKQYGADHGEERRYSPGRITGARKIVVHGQPNPARICTSHVESQNLTMRMQLRRLTRLTNAYSRKWANLRAALALHFAHYNLCWFHSSIRMTPAMKAGVTQRPWGMADLLNA
jgi:IS1 family transposase